MRVRTTGISMPVPGARDSPRCAWQPESRGPALIAERKMTRSSRFIADGGPLSDWNEGSKIEALAPCRKEERHRRNDPQHDRMPHEPERRRRASVVPRSLSRNGRRTGPFSRGTVLHLLGFHLLACSRLSVDAEPMAKTKHRHLGFWNPAQRASGSDAVSCKAPEIERMRRPPGRRSERD